MTNRKTGDEDVEWYWDWISGVGGRRLYVPVVKKSAYTAGKALKRNVDI